MRADLDGRSAGEPATIGGDPYFTTGFFEPSHMPELYCDDIACHDSGGIVRFVGWANCLPAPPATAMEARVQVRFVIPIIGARNFHKRLGRVFLDGRHA